MFGGSGFSFVAFASAPGFIYTAAVEEVSTASEQVFGSTIVNSSLAAAVSGSDLIGSQAVQNPVIAEIVSASDTISSIGSINPVVLEQAEIAEFRSIGGGYSAGSYASGAYSNLGDIVTKVSGDSVYALVNVNSAVSEVGLAGDIVARELIVPRSITESSQVSEVVDAQALFSTLVTDSIQAQDETTAFNAAFVTNVTEAAEASTAFVGVTEVNSAIQELTNLNDTIDNIASLNSVVDEKAQAKEVIPTNAQIWISLQESVRAADQFIARFLWEPVNTFETTNWAPITTAQLELRITVGGGFSAGAMSSGPYSGLGGVTTIIPADEIWEVKNTSQSTNWALVDTIN